MSLVIFLKPPSGFGDDVITVKDKTKTVIQAKCFGEGQSVGVEAFANISVHQGFSNLLLDHL
jgi:hypothetical protein